MGQCWEYLRRIVGDGEYSDGYMNKLGNEGWELVSAQRDPATYRTWMLFKRPT